MSASSSTFPTREERVKELTDKLEQGLHDLFQSDRYLKYLDAMSKFHNYSFNNVLLIMMQNRHATHVASFTSWRKDFKRSVKHGEKGIKILAPYVESRPKRKEKIDPKTNLPILDENGDPVTEIVFEKCHDFKVAYVFDISQTEGQELPSIVTELTGTVRRYSELSEAVEKLSPVPVLYKDPPSPRARGCYSHLERCIYVLPGMSQVQTLKTLIHEVAHAKLHALPIEDGVITAKPEKSKSTREVEAESVAYVVCHHFGVDTSDYSLGYVAGWSKGRDLRELKSSLACIRNTASELIEGIERSCHELSITRARNKNIKER